MAASGWWSEVPVMSTCLIVLTHHLPRDEQQALIRDYQENIGPRVRLERGFRHLHIIHSAHDPQLLLVLMEWTGDHLFHSFKNSYMSHLRYEQNQYRLFTTRLSVRPPPKEKATARRPQKWSFEI
jgi:hypothetical protein